MTSETNNSGCIAAFDLDSSLFSTIFGDFPGPVIVLAQGGMTCVAANRAALRHWNGGRDELGGLSLDSLFAPPDVARWLRVRSAACQGTWLSWECELREGASRRTHFDARQIRWNGDLADFLVGAACGTEQARSGQDDAAENLLSELAPCGLGRYSMDRHRMLSANSALAAMMTGEGEVLERCFLFAEEWAGFLTNCAAGLPFEQRCVWRSATLGRLNVRLRARPEKSARDFAVSFSVEDCGAAQDAVRRNAEAARMESLGRMAAGVAHDFNNLLLIIRGHAEMIEEDLPAYDESREHASRLLAAARQATEITGTMLAFSRQEELPQGPILLGDAIADAAELVQASLPAAITLDTQVEDNVELNVAGPHVEQIVMNLAWNARDAMPDGGRLGLRCGWQPGDSHGEGSARIEVSDTGTGMDEETRARIFEAFFTTKTRGRGTGLGLAMVQALVSQYGGSVSVDSAPGQGTTIVVLLPALRRVPGNCVIRDAERLPTILLVDDEPEIRRLVDGYLTRLGYRVLQAADAREALLRAGENASTIDLLLTDVVMPHMDGFELALMLREQIPELPIVVMSGFTGGAMARKGKLLGKLPLLSKPFSLRQLEATVKDALAGRKKPCVAANENRATVTGTSAFAAR